MKLIYETNRLFLKILSEEHTDKILDFLIPNMDFFQSFESIKVPEYYTYNYQHELVKHEYLSALGFRYVRFYVFEKEAPEKIIGTVSLSNITPFPYNSCVLGYKFDPAFHGNGYATEALIKTIEFAFCEVKLHRLQASVLENNTPSIKLMERLGFNLEGKDIKSINVNGKWMDHLRYSLINYTYFTQN